VLAALGKPETTVEAVRTIRPRWINTVVNGCLVSTKQDEVHEKLSREAAPVIEKFFLTAAHDRDRAWQLAFIDALAESKPWALHDSAWPLVRALMTLHALTSESEAYLRWFVGQIGWNSSKREGRSGTEIAALLTESNNSLLTEFWALFRVEGVGGAGFLTSSYHDNGRPWWNDAIAILCDTVPGFRDRILDESLGALLRDFSANNSIWYPRVHRALDPTPDEVATRATRYEALLAAGPSTTVGLAQDMLARAIDRIDPAAFLEASASVLGRSEKKLLAAQIKLLAALVKAHPKYAARVSEFIAGVMETLPADVAAAARKLVPAGQGSAPAPDAAPAGTPITIPEPRREAIPHQPDRLAPLDDADELWQLVSACFEGVGHGRDLARILDGLSRHADFAASETMLARAEEVMTSWDKTDASPRRHLAGLLLARAKRQPRQLRYVGYRRHVFPSRGETMPEGTIVSALGSRDKAVPTHMPTTLLVAQFQADAGQVAVTPLPATVQAWSRALRSPGEGYYGSDDVLGTNPKPVWLPVSETPRATSAPWLSKIKNIWQPSHKTPGATFAAGDLGISGAQEEYTLRAEEAREQDGFEQIVQWAAWLLSDNPDTLAAIYHPALDAAVRVVNVRGIGALLAALGATKQAPHGPVWSALALGLSAKMPEHRAAAAEAIAALAASGLLDPAPLAAEIAAHLKDQLVMAGRLAAALTDAASISAIAGYRVLQTLAALLSHLDGVNQAAKLVELAARLAADHGTPVAIPDALAGKRQGASVMAAALRALDTVTPRPTLLAEEAAALAWNK
jgi:hypothetical protein